MNTLYHYVHCPFCVRVRMACGYLNLKFKSVVLPYNEEERPKRLTGKKMLPIFQFDDASLSNESLDIIAKLDVLNRFHWPYYSDSEEWHYLEALLNNLAKDIHNLVMPYWVYTPEFDPESRQYFMSKKEQKRGPFSELMKNRYRFQESLRPKLVNLEKDLQAFWKSPEFRLFDILLASHLWGLYVLPEFQFSPQLHAYLQEVKKRCRFEYHEDFWLD